MANLYFVWIPGPVSRVAAKGRRGNYLRPHAPISHPNDAIHRRYSFPSGGGGAVRLQKVSGRTHEGDKSGALNNLRFQHRNFITIVALLLFGCCAQLCLGLGLRIKIFVTKTTKISLI